jgi:hypothetical protein
MDITPRVSVVYILENQKADLQIFLGVAGFALSLGFLAGSGNNNNYQLIFSFASNYVWALLYFLYASSKIYGTFFRTRVYVKYATNIVGLWAWNYILLSFTVFDSTPVAPTEVLLAVPVIIEFWTMLATPFKSNHKRRMREYNNDKC